MKIEQTLEGLLMASCLSAPGSQVNSFSVFLLARIEGQKRAGTTQPCSLAQNAREDIPQGLQTGRILSLLNCIATASSSCDMQTV